MGTKTIGITEEVYDKLRARKRDDESFTDVIDRLVDESTTEWRDGFGTLESDDADELRRFVSDSRERTGEGLARRQREAIERMADDGDDDEAP